MQYHYAKIKPIIVILTSLSSDIFKFGVLVPCVVIGYALNFMGFLHTEDAIISEICLVLTMLLLGLHIRLKSIVKQRMNLARVAIWTISNILLIATVANLFIDNMVTAFSVATILCLSSSIVCQQELYKSNNYNTEHGHIVIISTIFHDTIGLINYILIKSALVSKLNYSVGIGALVLVAAMKYAYNYSSKFEYFVDQYFDNSELYPKFFIITLMVSYMLNMPLELVVVILASIFRNALAPHIDAIQLAYKLSLAYMFVDVGQSIMIVDLFDQMSKIVLILVIQLGVKLVTGLLVFKSNKSISWETAVKSVVLLSNAGELSFFMLPHLDISDYWKNIILMSSIMSMIITTPIYSAANSIFAHIRNKTTGVSKFALRIKIKSLNNYVLIVDSNKLSRMICEELAINHMQEAITIDENMDNLDTNNNCFFVDLFESQTYSMFDMKKIKCIVITAPHFRLQNTIIGNIRQVDEDVLIAAVISSGDIGKIHIDKKVIPVIFDDDDYHSSVKCVCDIIADGTNIVPA